MTGLAGFTVAVSPASLTLNPGQNASVHRDVHAHDGGARTRTPAGSSRWPTARTTCASRWWCVRWRSRRRREVTGTGGPISYNVMFGYTGAFSATPRGLIAATTTAGTVADDPTDGTCSLTCRHA